MGFVRRDQDLNKVFDLTPAEALMLRRLCEGLTVAKIVALLDVSVHTVRN